MLGSAFWGDWSRDNENFKQISFVDWLSDFALVEDYARPAEHQVHLIGVLNHILGDWTDGSTEYRIFADERFEENIIHITNGEVMFRTNIESGVVEVTGENTANLAPYIPSDALQSRTELKYDPMTDTIYVGNDNISRKLCF